LRQTFGQAAQVEGAERSLREINTADFNTAASGRENKKESVMSELARKSEVQVMSVAGGGPLTPMDMLDRALANGASVEVMERLMGLQERWEKNQARKDFDEAMAAAKSEIPVIFKNREVDFTSAKGRTNYRHEDLAGIARTVDPILAKQGLSYRFRTSSLPNEPVTVTCIVSHRSGHSEENSLAAGRDDSGNKNSIQAVGSTITYLQRYTLKAALGLSASTDDDGKTVDAGEAISEQQVSTIQSLIVELAADIPRFCKYMKVDRIDEIPAKQYQRAIAALEAKRSKS
jgi:hypothetical protein